MNTTLVILAAGLGSRFGGGSAKQTAVLGKNGEIMADYSVYDAIRAGFNKIVYVIKRDMEPMFSEKIASKIKGADVRIAFQDMDDLPMGFSLPSDRAKPWGTAHAVRAARHVVQEPFMMIHADDFYGSDVYATLNTFLREDNGGHAYAMGGYRLENTVSDHGGVSRGVCTTKDGYLARMDETHNIQKRPDGICYPAPDGNMKYLPGSTIVSMGAFAFKPSIFAAIEKGFAEFLEKNPQNPKAEYLVPDIVSDLITGGQATMKILEAKGQWYGVTYQEDKEKVQRAIVQMVEQGQYPERLF
ncbi:MAG: sugar phosphate nucleotidyltransferase [Defluviitaleaceae bacterium]|nr:sugar phosphate nucleotidyltransferase [Defluviitaleaceae bacterium]